MLIKKFEKRKKNKVANKTVTYNDIEIEMKLGYWRVNKNLLRIVNGSFNTKKFKCML